VHKPHFLSDLLILLKTFINLIIHLQIFLDFSIERSMSSLNDSFNYSFPVHICLISCLIALTRSSSMMLNRSGECGYLNSFSFVELKLVSFH